MNRTSVVLLLLLLATNAAWFLSRAAPNPSMEGSAGPGGPSVLPTNGTSPTRIEEPVLLGAAGATPTPTRGQQEAARRNAERWAAGREARVQVRAWRTDVLQVHDPGRRDAGLDAMAAGVRSDDARLALVALHSIFELRHAEYDSVALRAAVRSRLTDEDVEIRRAAARALLHAKPEAHDAERLLDLFTETPTDTFAIGAAIRITRRVDGRLAEAWLAAFRAAPLTERLQLARYLMGAWASAEVEEAVVDAFRRLDAEHRASKWYSVLGAFKPTRAPRVRLVFDVQRRGAWRGVTGRTGFERALDRLSLDPSASRLAVALAIELLDEPGDARAVSFCLDVLRAHGTSADAPAVRAYSENDMVARSTRVLAARIATELERRQ